MERRALLERLTELRSPRATQPGAERFASPNLGPVFSLGQLYKILLLFSRNNNNDSQNKKTKTGQLLERREEILKGFYFKHMFSERAQRAARSAARSVFSSLCVQGLLWKLSTSAPQRFSCPNT